MAADPNHILARAALKPLTEEEFRRFLIHAANAAERIVGDTLTAIRQALVDHQLVALVWGDLKQPDGINFVVIKGTAVLHEIVAAGQNAVVDVDIGAVWVSSSHEAQALGERFAEGDRRH
jgi:hypothetical protein